MEIIKFRAWDFTNENYWYSENCEDLADFFVRMKRLSDCGNKLAFEQYVVRDDENKQNIYDGDIVSCLGKICEVKFMQAQFIIQESATQKIYNMPLYERNIVVIGNIHKNKDLLL